MSGSAELETGKVNVQTGITRIYCASIRISILLIDTTAVDDPGPW